MSAPFTPIRRLAAELRAGEVSPVALAETALERLETLGSRLNAVITLTRDRALEAARRAERELAAGQDRGPLHGIPYGAKDLLATAGVPTTWGAAPFRDRVLDADAAVIRKLDEAGAVLVAKLAMVELAGGMGYRQPHAAFTGPGINPWHPEHWSGGSSSGSGSAVAAGLVPFSIGSETWGSILGPAAYCGVAGLRPSYGRVSRAGAMTLSWTLDKLGPIALTADDCGLILASIAGPDPADPATIAEKFHHDPTARRFRFGVVRQALAACDDAVRTNLESALEVLRTLGTVEDVTLPDLPYEAAARIILYAEAADAFDDLVESGRIAELTAPEDRYTPYARDAILAKDYVRALRLRGLMAREAARLFATVDLLVAPTRPTVAPRLGQELRSALRGTAGDAVGALGNLAGLPAISVPSGFDEAGLPTGMQLVGPALGDATVLAAACGYQALTDWHRRHPSPPGGPPAARTGAESER